ncbi:hypothetical protein ANANG_G00112100 [Anguilla anguilla]|uniref:Ig-like domain-containing protein n=1 Tax=Anguilla anguilla TaxID=7936 RepID=A0A9D3MKE7_ANGAN|nr:hypothetical protein ANANG_G00112100 [Anguilla anguilla]
MEDAYARCFSGFAVAYHGGRRACRAELRYVRCQLVRPASDRRLRFRHHARPLRLLRDLRRRPGRAVRGRGLSARKCASGMECVKDADDPKSKFGICVCKSNYEVCGSDGVTYKTGCDLKAASLKATGQEKPEITVQNKGKCAQAPIIVTPPKDIWNVTGSQVFLSCEAIGIPTPILTWKKISDGKGKAALLPGDRDNLAVQTRGGPEKHEVTGWVLISPLTEGEAGTYECHAINSKGEASAMGSINVVKSLDDIPTAKAEEDEEL